MTLKPGDIIELKDGAIYLTVAWTNNKTLLNLFCIKISSETSVHRIGYPFYSSSMNKDQLFDRIIEAGYPIIGVNRIRIDTDKLKTS